MSETQSNGQRWENLTIANNFMFYKIMRNNPDVCKELLEILLEFPIEKIEMSQEEAIDIDFGSKGVRLDVYAKDADGLKIYNIEMQASDTKELAERSRYYQGAIDVDILKSGQKYKDLKTSFVIFICIDDIFGNGLPKYTFENLCQENPKVKLNDRAYKYFFISENCDKLLKNAKRNAQWRKQFMDLEREKTYAFDRGMEQKTVEAARSFFANGASIELIAKSLNMTQEEVEKIVKDVAITA